MLAISVLRSQMYVDPDAVGVTGVSWGGVISANLISIDYDRLAFVIPAYGCGDLLVSASPHARQMRQVQSEDHYQQVWDSHMSEVSCENCAHTAIAAKKKGCYAQRDSGRVWTTPVMSGQGSRWDTKGIYQDKNTAVI